MEFGLLPAPTCDAQGPRQALGEPGVQRDERGADHAPLPAEHGEHCGAGEAYRRPRLAAGRRGCIGAAACVANGPEVASGSSLPLNPPPALPAAGEGPQGLLRVHLVRSCRHPQSLQRTLRLHQVLHLFLRRLVGARGARACCGSSTLACPSQARPRPRGPVAAARATII